MASYTIYRKDCPGTCTWCKNCNPAQPRFTGITKQQSMAYGDREIFAWQGTIQRGSGVVSLSTTGIISVLFVDDEPELTGIAQRFLERNGECRVRIAGSAKEALILLETGAYDAIVSDYMMPDMDGITFLKAVRSRNVTIPFIVFTGKGREEVVIEALNHGADFYLQKGGDPAAQFTELQSKIKKGVEQRRAKHELQEKNHILDAILAASPHGIALVRANRIEWVNEAFSRMLLYPKEELIAMEISRLFDDYDVYNTVMTQVEKDLENTMMSELRTRFRQKSGPLIDCEINIVPIEQRNRDAGIMVTVTNVTKSLAMAREIERLSAFPNLESNPVIELNRKGQISYFNEAAIDDLIRFGPGSTLELFIPTDLPGFLRNLDEENPVHEKRSVTIGDVTYCEYITVSPRFGVIRISAIDTAKHRKMQAALREIEDVLRNGRT